MTRKERREISEMLAEEGALAEQDRDVEVSYRRVGRPPKPVAERGQVYSIRIPVERLEELRRAAERRDKPPAVLARDWILERLDAESPSEGTRARRLGVGEQTLPYQTSRRSAASRRASNRKQASKASGGKAASRTKKQARRSR